MLPWFGEQGLTLNILSASSNLRWLFACICQKALKTFFSRESWTVRPAWCISCAHALSLKLQNRTATQQHDLHISYGYVSKTTDMPNLWQILESHGKTSGKLIDLGAPNFQSQPFSTLQLGPCIKTRWNLGFHTWFRSLSNAENPRNTAQNQALEWRPHTKESCR